MHRQTCSGMANSSRCGQLEQRVGFGGMVAGELLGLGVEGEHRAELHCVEAAAVGFHLCDDRLDRVGGILVVAEGLAGVVGGAFLPSL